MSNDDDLIWTLSASGTIAQIKAYLGGERRSPAKALGAGGAVPAKALRSKDSLTVILLLDAAESPAALVEAVRNHWATLRDLGLADAQPVKIFVASDAPQTVVYAFRWKDADARAAAETNEKAAAAFAAILGAGTIRENLSRANEVYQGFEHGDFPKRGAVELLRGKCTCVVELDGAPEPIELDGQNGFVIMHRGPRYRLENRWLMPVTILAHGADSPNPWAHHPVLRDRPEFKDVRVRVEQNTELPQFGIIRANGPDANFPATAMWVVHWRIHTPLGTIITDPKVPLVFGPTTVHHYPPVGTEFKSATGPVDVYNVESGKVVGRLIPGELTAFDIVVTMDDEIPSVMDEPARYHVEMFNKHVTDAAVPLSTAGLKDDYRVPLDLHQPAERGKRS